MNAQSQDQEKETFQMIIEAHVITNHRRSKAENTIEITQMRKEKTHQDIDLMIATVTLSEANTMKREMVEAEEKKSPSSIAHAMLSLQGLMSRKRRILPLKVMNVNLESFDEKLLNSCF